MKGEERPKIASLMAEVEDKMISMRNTLISFAETQQKKEEIIKIFNEIMEKIRYSYRKLVNPSIVTKDNKWITANYWDIDDECHFIEMFNNKIPTKEGLKDNIGYSVLLDGSFENGSTVCEKMNLDWGKSSAPRYLWYYLNKIADDKGVENPKETFESWYNSENPFYI